jgi:hypothetical protein
MKDITYINQHINNSAAIEEVLAHMRGESVDNDLVAELSADFKYAKKLRIISTDGDFLTYPLITLSRHFHYFALLHDVDPNTEEHSLPFPMRIIWGTITSYMEEEPYARLSKSLDCLRLLTPKDDALVLERFSLEDTPLDTLLEIVRGIPMDVKRYQHKVGEDISDYSYLFLADKNLASVLLEHCPSLIFYHGPIRFREVLILTSTFSDDEVFIPNIQIIARYMKQVARATKNPCVLKRMMTMLRVRHELLENENEWINRPFQMTLLAEEEELKDIIIGCLSKLLPETAWYTILNIKQ